MKLTTTYFVFLRAPEHVSEGFFHVSGESRRKHILFWAELMTRLPNDGVDHIKPRDLVLGLALEDELLDVLHDVLIELDGFHCRFCDRSHFCLRNWNLVVVEREELEVVKRFG